MLTNLIISFMGFLFLVCFAYLDYKDHKIENDHILIFAVCSGIVLLFLEKSLAVGLLTLITGILGVYLWKIKSFGGADTKILPAMIPFLLIISNNYFVGWWIFLIIFAVVGGLYGLIAKKMFKRKRYIPFVPAMALTYFLFYVYNLILVLIVR